MVSAYSDYPVITLENTMNDSQVTKDKLVSDFKAVVADTEELLKLTAGQAGDKVADVRVRLNDKLTAAKYKLQDLEAAVVEKTKAAARATDDFVNDKPWQAVGIAAGIGLLLGIIIGRRCVLPAQWLKAPAAMRTACSLP